MGIVKVCPVVLAGGLSSRMGRDKALLKLPSGLSMLEQAQSLLENLRPIDGLEFLPVLISGARPGGIPDRMQSCGPLAGLQAIVEHLKSDNIECDALLVVPLDMPLLGAAQLQDICLTGKDVEQSVCIGKYYLPCWLPLNDRCRNYLRTAEAGNAVPSIRALFGFLGNLQLPEPDGDWHTNVNCPEDFIGLAALMPSSLPVARF